MKIKITITVQEIFQREMWSQVCNLIHIDEWAYNEGLIQNDTELEFTEEQAIELGLFNSEKPSYWAW